MSMVNGNGIAYKIYRQNGEVLLAACDADLTPRSTRLKPSILDPDHILMKTIENCGLDPFGSSTLSDMALIPFPSVKMGPGDSARSHTAGEYVLITEVEEGIETYCRFLDAMNRIVIKSQNQKSIKQQKIKNPS